MRSDVFLKYIIIQVDPLAVTAAELYTRLVKFGSKHIGSAFQDASMDFSFGDNVLKRMEPKSFEEQLLTKCVKLALEDFKPTSTVKAHPAKFP